jgi:hypothetical protein
MVAVVLVLLVLQCVLCLVPKEGASNGAEETMAAGLVATKVACSAAADGTQEPAITFGLRIGVGGPVALLARRAVLGLGLLAVGILFLWVRALLRELLGWCLARVLMLSVLSLALAVLILGTLPMLEAALCRRSIASVRLLRRRLLLTVVTSSLWRWLLLILLVVALIVPLRRRPVALARCGRPVLAVRGVLLLAVALVVLVVGAGHGDVGSRETGGELES